MKTRSKGNKVYEKVKSRVGKGNKWRRLWCVKISAQLGHGIWDRYLSGHKHGQVYSMDIHIWVYSII